VVPVEPEPRGNLTRLNDVLALNVSWIRADVIALILNFGLVGVCFRTEKLPLCTPLSSDRYGASSHKRMGTYPNRRERAWEDGALLPGSLRSDLSE
jgi:hypothetical protein